MDVQSLLFARDSWTPARAKEWARSHGYKYGDVDVTDQYVRLRQFSPEGLKVKRTITFGRGIRAVVAREESASMTTRESRRRPRRRTRAKAPRKSARKARKARATEARRRKSTVMEAPRRRKKRTAKKRPARRRRRARAAEATTVKSPRRRRRRAAAAPKRRRRRRTAEAWRGDSAGHSRAARKGHRRRRRAASRRASPSRRRRRVRAVGEARRSSRNPGMTVGEFSFALVSAGLGFVLADGLDRFLATYNPTATEMPKDKFTSNGAGTLANTLNVASAPSLARIGAGIGMVAAPALASMYISAPFVRSSMQGLALGSGVSLFKTLWNNVLMPLLKPKDTSAASLQKSYIARLYPAEIAAAVNREAKQSSVSSGGGAGALSGAPGVGAADVGPYALGASAAGDALPTVQNTMGTGALPTVQNTWGTGADLPTAAQAMGTGALPTAAQAMGTGYQPGPPPGPGPGPQVTRTDDTAACACLGDDNQFLGFVGDEPREADTLYSGAIS